GRRRPSEYCVQLAHCGDSRAIVCRGDGLVCSEDHKPGRQDESDRIRAAGGSVMRGPLGGPLRVDGALAVSRAMGDFAYKLREADPAQCKVSAMPEVSTVTGCKAGDWVFIACDGIFDVMNNEEVHGFVQPRLLREKPGPADGGKIVTDLLRHCLEKGSKDNCTACLVQLQPGCPVQPPSKKLLQGGFAKASPEVREKYAEFISSHGFSVDGLAGCSAARPPPKAVGRGAAAVPALSPLVGPQKAVARPPPPRAGAWGPCTAPGARAPSLAPPLRAPQARHPSAARRARPRRCRPCRQEPEQPPQGRTNSRPRPAHPPRRAARREARQRRAALPLAALRGSRGSSARQRALRARARPAAAIGGQGGGYLVGMQHRATVSPRPAKFCRQLQAVAAVEGRPFASTSPVLPAAAS
ncbi:unnamed protein product, partial [Prorocentrum cordatum]